MILNIFPQRQFFLILLFHSFLPSHLHCSSSSSITKYFFILKFFVWLKMYFITDADAPKVPSCSWSISIEVEFTSIDNDRQWYDWRWWKTPRNSQLNSFGHLIWFVEVGASVELEFTKVEEEMTFYLGWGMPGGDMWCV